LKTPSEHISLSQLNTLVAEAIATHLEPSYWVVAELVEVRENYSGHCYLTLAEKEKDKVLAQSKAAIWQQTYRMVKPYFESSTGQSFAAGIKVRIKVSVSFHNVYGMNMTVHDIDPAYTVGEVTLRRQQILRQLEDDGVSEMNRELLMSDLPQRIAVISSPTAAGYEDFINQLENNTFGYKFHTRLFAATMQGEGAEASIIAAMEKIFEQVEDYDVLVIIRGGGAAIDLSCFDNYNIAYYITQFPIPVIVGIGHERDETVLDLVAHTALKTPTAVAAYLLELFQQTDAQLDQILERLQMSMHQTVIREKQHIYSITSSLPLLSGRIFSQKKTYLNHLVHRSENASLGFVRDQQHKISNLVNALQNKTHDILRFQNQKLDKAELIADLSDPKHVLKRGYSITMKDGKVIKDKNSLHPGDEIETLLKSGKLLSTVKDKS